MLNRNVMMRVEVQGQQRSDFEQRLLPLSENGNHFYTDHTLSETYSLVLPQYCYGSDCYAFSMVREGSDYYPTGALASIWAQFVTQKWVIEDGQLKIVSQVRRLDGSEYGTLLGVFAEHGCVVRSNKRTYELGFRQPDDGCFQFAVCWEEVNFNNSPRPRYFIELTATIGEDLNEGKIRSGLTEVLRNIAGIPEQQSLYFAPSNIEIVAQSRLPHQA